MTLFKSLLKSAKQNPEGTTKFAVEGLTEAYDLLDKYVLHNAETFRELKKELDEDANGFEKLNQFSFKEATEQSKKLGDEYAAGRNQVEAMQGAQDKLNDSVVDSRVAESNAARQQELGNVIGNPEEQARVNLKYDKEVMGIRSEAAENKAAREVDRAARAEKDNAEHIRVIEAQKAALGEPVRQASESTEMYRKQIGQLGIKSDEEVTREELAEQQKKLKKLNELSPESKRHASIVISQTEQHVKDLKKELKEAQEGPATYKKSRKAAEDTAGNFLLGSDDGRERAKSVIKTLDLLPKLEEAEHRAVQTYRDAVAPLEAQQKVLEGMKPVLAMKTKAAQESHDAALHEGKAAETAMQNREKELKREQSVAAERRKNQDYIDKAKKALSDPNLSMTQRNQLTTGIGVAENNLKFYQQRYGELRGPGRNAPGVPGAPSQQSQSGSQDQGQEAIAQAVSAINQSPVAKHIQELSDALTSKDDQIISILSGMVSQINQVKKQLDQINSQGTNDPRR